MAWVTKDRDEQKVLRLVNVETKDYRDVRINIKDFDESICRYVLYNNSVCMLVGAGQQYNKAYAVAVAEGIVQ